MQSLVRMKRRMLELSLPYESGLVGFFDVAMFVLEALVLENCSRGPSVMVGRCGCLSWIIIAVFSFPF